jgi:ABC-type lipoprotein release transport system permease subunit
MESVLFGVTSRDPLTFIMLPATVVTTTLLASLLPARRAASVDPVSTMRSE